MRIAMIGCGNMGYVLARAIVEKRVVAAKNLLLVESRGEQRHLIEQELGAPTTNAVGETLSEYDLLILAVKPQDAALACERIRPLIGKDQLLVSIMAGVSIAAISSLLPACSRIVRCMPNVAARMSKGMTAFFASAECSNDDVRCVESLFNACGATLRVQSEELIDAATAVSGSGPAYVFYLIEHFLHAAQSIGFSSDEARMVVTQTLDGALALWQDSQVPANELRALVTSKGGTTAAAVEVFDSKKLGDVFQEGVVAAFHRARELAGSLK